MRQKNEPAVREKRNSPSRKTLDDDQKEDIRRGQERMDSEGNTHSGKKAVQPQKRPGAGKDGIGSGQAKS